ncbi:MAG: universal stress protein [Chlamydiae bacterium]|nr:universal stress protein [Chlamydiota bacterium]
MADKIAQVDRGSMRRVLGVFDLFAVGYGDLGSSIYYALGITTLYALGATPIALMIAGFVFMCTALTYAEMSSVLPEAGGSASFSRKNFNDLISFIAGWGLMLDYIVTISISAYSISPYLAVFFPILKIVPVKLGVTVFFISFLMFLNFFGARHSTKMSLVLSLLAILTQVIIIAIGLTTVVDFSVFWKNLAIGGANTQYSPTWFEFGKGVGMAMVAYTGIESMAQLGSEAKKPEKTVPKAILLAMVTLLLMYIGLSMVALSDMTPQQLSGQYLEDPIAGIVKNLPFGTEIIAPWVGLLAAVLLFVAANAGLLGASRLAFNLGEFFQLPKFFYTLHPRFKSPYVALFFFGFCASMIVIISEGRLDFMADLYNFGAMIAFFSAHVALLKMRYKEPNLERPFKIPLNISFRQKKYPITAIIGAIATLSVLIGIIMSKPDGRYLGMLWLTIGVLMYTFLRKKYSLDITGSVKLEKVQLGNFKEMEIKKILVLCTLDPNSEATQVGLMAAKATGAKMDLLYVIEVPFAFSLQSKLAFKEAKANASLDFAQALAVEKGMKPGTFLVRSRSYEDAIVNKIEEGGYDLLILAVPKNLDYSESVARVINPAVVMKRTKSRVWVIEADTTFLLMPESNK